ncbi:MAG: LuxR C-terminal-related transcriptional regulator [Betaproteobacteria bacterium]
MSEASRSLSPKVSPPLASRYEVARREMCDRILDAGGAKLVLVRGGAGFGKTTLMRQLRQRGEADGLRTGWLTLDAADRFLGGLAQALEHLLPRGSSRGEHGEDGSGRLMLDLTARLSAIAEPFVLFFDDLDAIQGGAVLNLIQQLVAALPRGSQLVACSRSAPELGLGLLRARGWLLEVGGGDLAFTVEETDEYLRKRSLSVQGEDLRRIHERTEGWPAALWLASLAIGERASASEFIASFSGNHASLSEYLAEEVLERQTPEVRGFLLDTSILGVLTPALCDHVRGDTGSRELLGRLDRDALFVTPLDDLGESRRYHALFGQFLRLRLERLQPDRFRLLHLRASAWFVGEKRVVPAIEHALASGDRTHALGLLAEHAMPLLADARIRLLARWLGSIPRADLAPYPHLRVVHVWVVNFTRGPRAALAQLDEARGVEPEDDRTRALSSVLEPMLLSLCDRVEESYQLGLERMTTLPPRSRFARSMLSVTMASASMAVGRFGDARRFMDAARHMWIGAPDEFAFSLTEALDGMLDLLRGNLRQSRGRLQAALSPNALDPGRPAKANAMAAILLAEVLYEVGDIDAAERLLTVHIPLIGGGGLPDQLIGSHVLLSRIHSLRGDMERALQLLSELEFAGHRLELRRLVLSARLARARLLLEQGKLEASREELELADGPEWTRIDHLFLLANDVETHELGQQRWTVRCGKADLALPALMRMAVQAEKEHRFRRLLKLRVLIVEALYRSGQATAAMRQITTLLAMAAPDGYLRIIVEEGPVVSRALREWRQAQLKGLVDTSRTVPEDYLERLSAVIGVSESALGEHPAAATALPIEPLTRKEAEVLALLGEGHSNRVLAEKMFLSEATIRTHLRNINSKFGVHSRMHAIAVARRIGLLD